jgi:hypothetical protein
MSGYTFTQDDFKNATQIDINDLQNQINGAGLTSATIQYINYSEISPGEFTIETFFSGPLSTNDLDTLTLLINDYVYVSYENILATITDTRSTGTNGGTFTAGSWVTRTLNTIAGSQNFCTLNNNQFTVIPGTYHFDIAACACGVKNHQVRLWDVTNNVQVAVSANGYTSESNDCLPMSIGININFVTTYEIHHQCVQTVPDYGFGRSVGFGSPEIYCTVTIHNNST